MHQVPDSACQVSRVAQNRKRNPRRVAHHGRVSLGRERTTQWKRHARIRVRRVRIKARDVGQAAIARAAAQLAEGGVAGQGPARVEPEGTLARIGARHGPDLVAGTVAALVTVAYCVSFSALVFQGDLKGGLPEGLWALLLGAAIAGVIVAATTTLPPAEAGPDNPAIAVLGVLATTVAAPVIAAGGAVDVAVRNVLVAISVTTFVTGAVLWLLGRLRLGPMVRFVPFPVIGGFLAASGWLLVTGGIEVITGRDITLATLGGALTLVDLPKVAIAVAFAVCVLIVRQRTGNGFVLPVAFFGAAAALDAILHLRGEMTAASGWFVAGSGAMEAWSPIRMAAQGDIDWMVIVRALPEIGAVAGVTVLALLLDVSSLEVARSKVADLDAEFRSNGVANMIAAPLGGFIGNLSLNASRMLEESGSRSRMSGMYAALLLALVVLARVDLAALVPTPMLGGLLIYMGLLVLREALLRSPADRNVTELGLSLLIMLAIIQFGYLSGVVLGFVGACLMFAFSYSRVGVIRRHVTRAHFGSNVERGGAARELLEAEGDRIHVFWLSGFIFFGSSNGLFERICATVGPPSLPGPRYLVLDFQGVSGCDTSAVLSLVKLRNWAREHRTTLVWASLSEAMRGSFERAGIIGPVAERALFASRADALEWCEERILAARLAADVAPAGEGVDGWLAREFGEEASRRLLDHYFQRREMAGGERLYAQGAPADTIDLVATGSIAIDVIDGEGETRRVRRMAGRTVVGEMGFFRDRPRGASIVAEGPTVVFVLSRRDFDRLMADEPELGARFLQFIVRALSDRVEFANKEIAALL